MIEFCNTVIEVSTNPECILQAYAVKTQCCLELGDLNKAQALAIEALNLYDEKYRDPEPPGSVFLNAKAASYYLEYLLKSGMDISETDACIKKLKKLTKSMPEFHNYLLYIKAMQKDLTACPVEDAIAAYRKLDLDPENDSYLVKTDKNSQHNYFVNAARRAIKQLEDEYEEVVTMYKPFIAKKYIMAEELQLMNETGQMDVTIIQHSLPNYETSLLGSITRKKKKNDFVHSGLSSTIVSSNSNKWQKVEINGEIYWMQIAKD
ncbi:MAG: hypothetical protein K9N06_02045 [Candidatus Cloacimonetes bacterium]|nr:hypothetical protein [Candidatus Cloacimonadota bacterium]